MINNGVEKVTIIGLSKKSQSQDKVESGGRPHQTVEEHELHVTEIPTDSLVKSCTQNNGREAQKLIISGTVNYRM